MSRADNETHRCFIAIEPPAQTLDALVSFIEELRGSFANGPFRWANRQTLHVTLHFLGGISQDSVDDAAAAMRTAAARGAPFDLEIRGIGVFPNHRSPRVVWAGFDAVDELDTLHAAIGEELAARSFSLEKRRFTGHITLGRAHRRASPRDLRAAGSHLKDWTADPVGRFSVRSVALLESQLRPDGPIYTRIQEARLGRE